MTTRYLKITVKELEALIETADSCDAMGMGLSDEAEAAVKAYKAVLKRNGLEFQRVQYQPVKTKMIK